MPLANSRHGSSASKEKEREKERDTDRDESEQLSDAALRKKKNADAQAAFRARRANYISTLEETVTNLELVVLQLQESVREREQEASCLKLENERLKQAGHERDSFWRTLWTHKGESLDDIPPLQPVFGPYPHGHPVQQQQHVPINASYAMDDQNALAYPVSPTATQSTPYPMNQLADYSIRTPPSSFAHPAHDGRSHPLGAQRAIVPKYEPYPAYSVPPAARPPDWPQPVAQSSSSGADSGRGSNGSTNSPTFVESPVNCTTPDLAFNPARYSQVEDHKSSPINTASYVYPIVRSPSATPSSSSSTHTSTYFALPENATTNEDFRRNPLGHGPEVTLHGGIANISVPGHANDGVRYRIAPRRSDSGPERSMFPALPSVSQPEAQPGAIGGDDGAYGRLRPKAVMRSSRSPSPGPAPISGTLAVIKAQAFGALRRTRGRKKGDDAAKMAKEALEARGITLGIPTANGTKRQRTRYDDDDSS